MRRRLEEVTGENTRVPSYENNIQVNEGPHRSCGKHLSDRSLRGAIDDRDSRHICGVILNQRVETFRRLSTITRPGAEHAKDFATGVPPQDLTLVPGIELLICLAFCDSPRPLPSKVTSGSETLPNEKTPKPLPSAAKPGQHTVHRPISMIVPSKRFGTESIIPPEVMWSRS